MPHEFSEEKFRITRAADLLMEMKKLRENPNLMTKAKTELARRSKESLEAMSDDAQAQNILDNPAGNISFEQLIARESTGQEVLDNPLGQVSQDGIPPER